jgi:beta-lactamase regulating signal transducer with metallopeptidase domain
VSDLLIQATISNLLVSTLLAGFAWTVQVRVRSASLVNLLWVVVLIKLITPPMFLIPAIELPNFSYTGDDAIRDFGTELSRVLMRADAKISTASAGSPSIIQSRSASESIALVAMRSYLMNWALSAWIGVSALLFLVSTVRILRFNRLLKANSRLAPKHILEISRNVAERIGIRGVPRVVLSGAQIAPFVWWLGGKPRITLSEQAVDALSRDDLRLVIAHEMAHIKRRDHWVRWLEWFAVNSLWWNPVTWWARSQLRISEEIACDNLVIESIEPERRRYANALLNVAELMTSPVVRPPAVVSGLNSGGDLERRLMMIIAEKTWQAPAVLRRFIAGVAVCILPLGLVYGQDMEAVERRLANAVGSGELTLDQAKVMMGALRQTARSGGGKTDRVHDVAGGKIKYAAIARKLKAAVDDGKMSAADAKKKLGAIRQEMFGSTDERAEKDRDPAALKTKYAAIARKLKAAVDDGKMSAADAKKQLGAIRQKVLGSTDEREGGSRRDP